MCLYFLSFNDDDGYAHNHGDDGYAHNRSDDVHGHSGHDDVVQNLLSYIGSHFEKIPYRFYLQLIFFVPMYWHFLLKAGGKSPKNSCINAFLTGVCNAEKASCTSERKASNVSFFQLSDAGGKSLFPLN